MMPITGTASFAFTIPYEKDIFDSLISLKGTSILSDSMTTVENIGLCSMGKRRVFCQDNYFLPDIHYNQYYKENLSSNSIRLMVLGSSNGAYSRFNNPFTDNHGTTRGVIMDKTNKLMIFWYFLW